MKEVYINAMGTFLPGKPIGNDEMEDFLGRIAGKPSRLRKRILRQNRIRLRHYALDKDQQSTFSNAEMAALAIHNSLQKSSVDLSTVDYLAAASSQGDLPLPGFASMVHGELGGPAFETASLHGVCASGIAAMKSAYLQVKSGEKKVAVTCASEFASRAFKSSRFETQNDVQRDGLPFEAEFLRWMLSDGAGAALLQPEPNARDLSLRVEWIRMHSLANKYGPCMYVAPTINGHGVKSWLDYSSVQEAADHGALNLRQEVRMLKDLVAQGVAGFFQLIEEGLVDPRCIDWMACHYSSHVFKEETMELLRRGGVNIPEERWVTKLYDTGNIGSASIYITLEDLLYSDKLKPGQQVLCVVPESGRFSFAYMLLKVIEPRGMKLTPPKSNKGFGPPSLETSGSKIEESLVRRLSGVWVDFENELRTVPIIQKLYAGRFTLEDYRSLLFNLRQQVIDGSRWISRAASNITREYFEIRSAFIAHSSDEHRDFEMLEANFQAAGGNIDELRNGSKNIGSEALSGWILNRASRENPFDLIGTMFIIEGLGQRIAHHWGKMIQGQLELSDDAVSFFVYHGVSDEIHFKRLDLAIQSGILTEKRVEEIVKAAKVTARLYRLQLEEIGNF